MRLTQAVVERLLPSFVEVYKEGGNNVLEVQIPGCSGCSVEEFCAELARNGVIINGSDMEGDFAGDQLANRLRKLVCSPEQFVSFVALWKAHEIWFQAVPSNRSNCYDLCIMYKDQDPFLEQPYNYTTMVPALQEYLEYAISLCVSARGRAVVLTESAIPADFDELPLGALLVWKNIEGS